MPQSFYKKLTQTSKIIKMTPSNVDWHSVDTNLESNQAKTREQSSELQNLWWWVLKAKLTKYQSYSMFLYPLGEPFPLFRKWKPSLVLQSEVGGWLEIQAFFYYGVRFKGTRSIALCEAS